MGKTDIRFTIFLSRVNISPIVRRRPATDCSDQPRWNRQADSGEPRRKLHSSTNCALQGYRKHVGKLRVDGIVTPLVASPLDEIGGHRWLLRFGTVNPFVGVSVERLTTLYKRNAGFRSLIRRQAVPGAGRGSRCCVKRQDGFEPT
jgi:hypothetical protein